MTQGLSADDGGAYDGLAVPNVLVQVIDNDAPGVLVLQTDGTTGVVEPTTWEKIGTGQVLEGTSATEFKADFGMSIL